MISRCMAQRESFIHLRDCVLADVDRIALEIELEWEKYFPSSRNVVEDNENDLQIQGNSPSQKAKI